MLEFRRALVTGGAGFIGSHLVDRLTVEGCDVVVLDDFSSGRAQNLADSSRSKKLRIIEGNICDETAVRKAAKDAEVVFHLAAQSSVEQSAKNPAETQRINVDGTKTLLEVASKAGVKRFVFASSAAVYGNPRKLPVVEGDKLAPISPYGESKLAGEKLCGEFNDPTGLATCRLRYFNVYGPRCNKGDVISSFLEAVSNNRRPVIYGNGTQSRDFVYVKDAVAATLSAAVSAGTVGQAINVCTGIPTQITAVLELISNLVPQKASGLVPEYLPARAGDIHESYGSPNLARQLMDFGFRTSIQEGLEALLNRVW